MHSDTITESITAALTWTTLEHTYDRKRDITACSNTICNWYNCHEEIYQQVTLVAVCNSHYVELTRIKAPA